MAAWGHNSKAVHRAYAKGAAEPEKNQKRTVENTRKIMEKEEYRQITPRRSWTTTHMRNSRLAKKDLVVLIGNL
jgi:hypothetical protein